MILLSNRILVLPEKVSQSTQGGIFLPDTVKQKRNVGLVVLIGDGVDPKFDKRRVLFNKLVEENMEYEGLTVSMLFVTDVIAILD